MKAKNHHERFKKFQVDITNFRILHQLESGGFGSVFSVENIKTGNLLAAKSIINHSDEEKYKLMINREIGIMIKCQHPTIIKFHGYSLKDFNNQRNAVIFMDLATNGSLSSLIQKVKSGLLDKIYDNTTRQIILVGIAYGMMHLHRHKIMHRDLKPGNILLDEDLHPHITDFGLSKIYNSVNSNSQSQQCGTSVYMAPEVIKGTHYSTKADVYSFGILMYEVVTDLTPYPLFEKGKMTMFQFTNKVVNENYRPKFTIKVKKSIQNLIEKCWSNNLNERPTFEDLFKKLAYNEDSEDEVLISTDENEDIEDENKYYLEGVDEEEVLLYADDIDSIEPTEKESDSIDQSKITEIVKSLISPLKDENEQLKEQIIQLKDQIDQFQKEKVEMKNRISSLEKVLHSSNNNIKEINSNEDNNTNITIKDFNCLSLNEQQLIVSCLCHGEMNQYFTNINNLLLLFIKFIKNDDLNIIEINTDNEQQKLNEIIKEEEIQIRFSGTEKLFLLNLLNSPDLNSILFHFDHISFQIKYNTQNFDNIYSILVDKKNIPMSFNLNIFIDEEEFTDKFFNGRTAINSLNFSPSVKIINGQGFFKIGCFNSCTNLKSVKLPNSLTLIGISSFANCTSLVEIRIPSSVTEIDVSAFEQCTALKNVIFDDFENSNLDVIGPASFNECSSLVNFLIPLSVTKISTSAFVNCTGLKKVTIPSSVKEIGNQCFFGCSSLETIEIHTSLQPKSIGSEAFPQNANIIKIQ